DGFERRARLGRLRLYLSAQLMYLNSAGSAQALRLLPRPPRVLAHIHELEVQLRQDVDPYDLEILRTEPTRYVAASNAVREALGHVLGVSREKIDVCEEPIVTSEFVPASAAVVRSMRAELGIGPR